MGDMGDIFRGMTKAKKERKRERLAKAVEETRIEWTKHTEYHWSIDLNEGRLNYWPSTTRFTYIGRTHFGGVEGFIAKRTRGKE